VLVLGSRHILKLLDNLVLMLIITGEVMGFFGLGIKLWYKNVAMVVKGRLFEGDLARTLLFGFFL
jgi:hypothetical protein